MPGRLLNWWKKLWHYLDEQFGIIETKEFKAFQYTIDYRVDFIMNEHNAVPLVKKNIDICQNLLN